MRLESLRFKQVCVLLFLAISANFRLFCSDLFPSYVPYVTSGGWDGQLQGRKT